MSGNNSSRIKIIGLTGGIASGKNFVAEIFAQNGAAIFDADKEVHDLLELDGSTINQVKEKFPQCFVGQKIERKILGQIVFADAKKLQILEAIIHPKIRQKYQEFLEQARKEKRKVVVLNIPLLLEKEGYECDLVVSVLASPSVQKKRFLARARRNNPRNFALEKKGLERKFEHIRSKQMSNKERKARADFVVNSSGSKDLVRMQVLKFLDLVASD